MSSNDYKTKDSVGIQITLVKLKGPNYLLWAKVVRVYITTKEKPKHVVEDHSPQESNNLMSGNKITL